MCLSLFDFTCMITSSCICVAADGIVSFFFMAEWDGGAWRAAVYGVA